MYCNMKREHCTKSTKLEKNIFTSMDSSVELLMLLNANSEQAQCQTFHDLFTPVHRRALKYHQANFLEKLRQRTTVGTMRSSTYAA